MKTIKNSINRETTEMTINRRVLKSWENVDTIPIDTGTDDNIDRAGFLSIEEQYDAFKRAGINAVERLKAMYPDASIKQNEEDLLKNKDIVRMAEKGIRENLDIEDRKMMINEKIKQGEIELNRLKEEQRGLIDKGEQQNIVDKAVNEAMKTSKSD